MPLGVCAVDGCGSPCSSSGVSYCQKHQARLHRYGRLDLIRRENGNGNINKAGYVDLHVDGRRVYEHVLNAERVLGKRLPTGAKVHHVNGIKSDNRNCNLVVCPNEAYHKLLHRRMKEFGITSESMNV